MKMNLDELYNRFNELIQKPIKSKLELELQQEISDAIEIPINIETKALIFELNQVGVGVSSLWDLVYTSKKYPNAIPILLEHLSKKYSEKTKEGIIRALAVKEAIGKASAALIAEFLKMQKSQVSLRWAIGNTINVIIVENDVEMIIPIVKDKEHGLSRQMFVSALGKVTSDKAEDVLIELLDDDDVVAQAIEALGKLKSKKAMEKITALTSHPKAFIRKEARRALNKLL